MKQQTGHPNWIRFFYF